ncbi:60S ribosomal protein L5, putative [Trypanosoma cruzi]|uniref:60S ribosomal protein L5, putative n=4 Tax=Trypanosoma cruzi TaxID=5693 RepID=Q4CU61_TRYCC|nr:60S ribosomal protein L5, putative [Trypanosoma cruzi]XP_814693.1 60S ribosomal protein L5, putative [Trypanosoma cruzi]PBJ73054.1 60S ribosomal protein L5 [Trypanosoma cruzi cruzi]EAN83816.1 60S ribosomal protein L5, putative [Trypanosoma cruzi]EAN92842.1 60S ribosomal protein L5, putative [Trypanosoma cruzi]EKG03072.1 60S ribosomal protein L5, putative [Trypanosoma cruzi]EKG07783.1 60S ribosomal protein L5, putative [Trypanosoma cruzi]|eukprot:XP_805667.1 60S ribosomal protein L5 [Trypanosoma cruzi strain CL Brener]
MPFVKVVKNKAYFKRFQVKYRRRREGKTDYQARRQMVLQDKTKFGTPKYRLVVRITNRDIIAQVVQAKVVGDEVVMAAYSHELPQFGIQHGLTNYAAAYATGLLVARRMLTKLGLANKFEGTKEADGSYSAVRTKADDQGDDEKRFPFKAILDVGLARTTTGARVFGVMKGAVDGGLAVPHRPNRFPGYDKEKDSLNAKAHRDRILGLHVAEYLKQVREEASSNPEESTCQFSKYIKDKVVPNELEGMYKKAHAAIRADPMKRRARKERKEGAAVKKYNTPKRTGAQKKAAAKEKIAFLVASIRERASK